MNILVTGANGQLGNEMRRVAAERSDNYTFTDVAELDITDIDKVMELAREVKPYAILNCAAFTNVNGCAARADLINNQAAGNLAYAAKEAGATLIHVSTDYVFDGSSSIPYIETDDTCPTGVYGKTKLAGEMAVIATGCRSIIIRTAWLYSRWGNNFVKTMRRLTAERDSINVVFDQVGSPTFAGDLADAISHIIENRLTDRTGVYHFTDEGVCSWYDLTVAIAEASGNCCDIHPIHSYEYPSKVERPHYSVLDKSKFRNTFGFAIPHWHASLKKCITQLESDK